MRSLMKFCLLLLLLGLSFSYTMLFAFPALADEGFNGYAVSNMILESKGIPGEVVNKSFYAFNDTGKDAQVQVIVRDFEKKDNQIIYLDYLDDTASLAKWSSVDCPEFILGPKQHKIITINTTIPVNATEGEHMALATVKFLPAAANGMVTVFTEVSPIYYVIVTDMNGNIDLKKSWELLGFSFTRLNGGLFKFSVKNTGKVHLISGGTITIRNIFTREEIKNDIPNVNLLPNATKEIFAEWTGPDFIGFYRAYISFTMDSERFVENAVTLIMFPWKMAAVTVFFISLLMFLIRLYVNIMKRRILKEVESMVAMSKEDKNE